VGDDGELARMGWSGCCGAGTKIPKAADKILSLIRKHRLAA